MINLDKPNFYKDTKKFFEFQMGKISTVGDKNSRSDKNYIVPLHTLGMELIEI